MSNKTSFFAALILLIGTAIRCTHLFLIDFIHEPFRLGGLFIAFADEIASNHFQLPVTIPYYSAGGIPFAYPPLGFYVEAVLLKIFPDQIFAIANILPPLVSILALGLAAYFFHRWAGGWDLRSLSALIAYAFLPNAFYNQIEAAGLAEAFGSLALIVYFILIFGYQEKSDWMHAVYAGLGLALCVLASPGSALGGALISVVLALDVLISTRWSQRFQPYLHLLCIAFIGIALSAPYWLSVGRNHGMNIFFTPVGMQYEVNGETSLLGKLQYSWFTYSATQLDGVYFWSIAILLGIGWLLWKRKFLLPLAFLILFSVPRENAWLTAFPAAMLVAYGVTDVLAPRVKSFSAFTPFIRIRIVLMASVLIIFSMILQAFELVNVQVTNENWKLEPAKIEDLRRAREIIPASAPVIVLGNGGLREWSPYLLQREVLNTEFGLEWQPEEYHQIMATNAALEETRNWQDVVDVIQLPGEQKQVYLIVDPTQLPAGFETADGPFLVKMETPALQVGILEIP